MRVALCAGLLTPHIRPTAGLNEREVALPTKRRPAAELGAAGAQDLFVYSLPKLKLHKGQRAAMPILAADVPYRDLYTWDVHDTRRDTETASIGKGVKSPLQLSENRVWHQLVLSNNSLFGASVMILNCR